jgi:hypothetical protein
LKVGIEISEDGGVGIEVEEELVEYGIKVCLCLHTINDIFLMFQQSYTHRLIWIAGFSTWLRKL